MNTATASTRGVQDRGLTRSAAREKNLPSGAAYEVIPNRVYNLSGFDIGSADLSKPGMKQQLEPIVQQIQSQLGQSAHPIVRVTGHASDSTMPGKGPAHYAAKRSQSVADYLVSRGIPREWIVTDTSREVPVRRAGAPQASSEAKARARAATIEIDQAERGISDSERFGDITYFKLQPGFRLPNPTLPLPIIGASGIRLPSKKKVLKKIAEIVAKTAARLGLASLTAEVMTMLLEIGVLVNGVLYLTVEDTISLAEKIHGKKFGPGAAEQVVNALHERVEQHHLLVQELMDYFTQAGINPNHYTQFMVSSVHRWLHRTGWNETLSTFFEAYFIRTGRRPRAELIAEFLAQMIEHWGIEQLPIEEYLHRDLPIKRRR